MDARRSRIVWVAGAVLMAATVWGLAVSIGAGDGLLKRSGLPAAPAGDAVGRAEVVARAAWGVSADNAGVDYEGEARGPQSFGVDDRGRVYLLDQENERVLRYAGERWEKAFALPDRSFDDIVVARDRVAVLSRFEPRRVLLFGEDGRRIAEAAIASGVPDVLRVRILNEMVCVECPGTGGMRYHPVVSLSGKAQSAEDQSAPMRTHPTLPSGDALAARKIDKNHLAFDVADAKGEVKRKLRLDSARDISAIVDVFGDAGGNIYVAYGLAPDDPDAADGGRLVVSRYDSAGEPAGRVEAPADDMPEPQRKILVTEAGAIYQLTADETGVRVLRWTLAD